MDSNLEILIGHHFLKQEATIKGGSSNVEMGQTFTDLIQQSLGHVFVVPIYESALEEGEVNFHR